MPSFMLDIWQPRTSKGGFRFAAYSKKFNCAPDGCRRSQDPQHHKLAPLSRTVTFAYPSSPKSVWTRWTRLRALPVRKKEKRVGYMNSEVDHGDAGS